MTSWTTFAKRTVALPWRLARPLRRVPTRWVLTFHEIGEHRWATTPERFREHLRALASGASVGSLADVVEARQDAGIVHVAITFDDGYVGVARHGAPLLDAAGMTASVFLPTDLLPAEDGAGAGDRGLYDGVDLMGWTTVRRLAATSTLTFESHGASHRSLAGLDDAERRAELTRSRARIEAETGRTPRFLAYPFGAADFATAGAAKDAGYAAAFTTRHGGLCDEADAYLLPRVDVRADYSPRDVARILRGDWDFLSRVQSMRNGRA